MGVTGSVPEPRPPWIHHDPTKVYSPNPEEAIKRLSESPNTFLEPHASYAGVDFNIENELDRVQGAINADSRIQQWKPKLVPKRVDEGIFWRNYFSHVAAILNTVKVIAAPVPAVSPASNLPAEVGDHMQRSTSLVPSTTTNQPAASSSTTTSTQPQATPASTPVRATQPSTVPTTTTTAKPGASPPSNATSSGLSAAAQAAQAAALAAAAATLATPPPTATTSSAPSSTSASPRAPFTTTPSNQTGAATTSSATAASTGTTVASSTGAVANGVPVKVALTSFAPTPTYDPKRPSPPVPSYKTPSESLHATNDAMLNEINKLKLQQLHQPGPGVHGGIELKEDMLPMLDESKLGRPIRWGIIGCGDVTETKSGPALQKCRGSQLVAVMRTNVSLSKDYARRHNVPRYYTQARSLIMDQDVDAVYIATPPGLHMKYALDVLAAGKPCLVEKPIARTADEARTMVDDFHSQRVPLYSAYYRRALPRFIKAKQLISYLGTVTSISAVLHRNTHLRSDVLNGWRLDAERSGGGLFMDVGCHTLDLIDFLLGPLSHVAGDAVSIGGGQDVEVETAVSMTFRVPNGALGSASWNFAAAIEEDKLTITGSKGVLSLSVFGNEPISLRTVEFKTAPDGKSLADVKSVEFQTTMPEHVHLPLIQTIVDELRARAAGIAIAPRCTSTGESALRTAVIMDAVLRKYYRNRSDDFWARKHTWATPPTTPQQQQQQQQVPRTT